MKPPFAFSLLLSAAAWQSGWKKDAHAIFYWLPCRRKRLENLKIRYRWDDEACAQMEISNGSATFVSEHEESEES
jgi:hypothetical protein